MRRALWAVAAVAAGLGWAESGLAQGPSFSNGDPFFLYYGWFLPQQAALANQPRVQDTIQQNVAMNQANAQTNRSSLYDPNGGYGRFDPTAPGDPLAGGNRGGRPGTGIGLGGRGTVPYSHANGRGPALYYNRTSHYYPSMRAGQGANRNVAVGGRGIRRGGSMPAMPSMPGPR
jgi:hypothetical protein